MVAFKVTHNVVYFSQLHGCHVLSLNSESVISERHAAALWYTAGSWALMYSSWSKNVSPSAPVYRYLKPPSPDVLYACLHTNCSCTGMTGGLIGCYMCRSPQWKHKDLGLATGKPLVYISRINGRDFFSKLMRSELPLYPSISLTAKAKPQIYSYNLLYPLTVSNYKERLVSLLFG